MNNKRKSFLTWGVLLLAFVLVCLALMMDGNTAVASPDINPDWSNAKAITNSTYGATLPIVKSSPDGETVMIVFNQHISDIVSDNDPYYSRSTDNGANWSVPAAIHESSAKSRQVHLDYDANGVAHVVWQENTGLAYANEGSKDAGNWNSSYVQLVAPISLPASGVDNPHIIASGNNRIDIVWSDGDNALFTPNIYHIRSKDGGNDFSIIPKNTVYDSGWESKFPSMVVEDSTGVIHLVWQEIYNFESQGHIVYSRGTESSGSMDWSTPVIISTVADAREPEIALANDTLQVVYTDYRSNDNQYIRHTQCAANCININNWQDTTNAISGQISGANGDDPLNLVADVIQWRSCTVSYFHGTSTDFLADNEIIWGVDSCAKWSESPRDKITSETIRSLNPSLSTQDNWWLYLVYEQGNTDARQIYFQRTKPDIYLPAVFNSK